MQTADLLRAPMMLGRAGAPCQPLSSWVSPARPYICGSLNRSAVGTLVERQTRCVLVLHLPDSHEATVVQAAMEKAIKRMPAELFKTLTWDRGKEMAAISTSRSPPESRSMSSIHTALATRIERERQRASPSIPSEGHRSFSPQRRGSDQDRGPAQRSASQDSDT